jgi:HEAT repeat protein
MTSLRAHRLCAAIVLTLVALVLVPAASAQQLPFEQVVVQLKSPDPAQRLTAVKLLGESGYPEAAVPVAPLLGDRDERIQREAFYAELLFFVPASRKDGHAALHAFEANWAAMPVERVPMPVVTNFLPMFASPNASLRTAAVYAVGVLGQVDGIAPDAAHKAVVDALVERLTDPEPAMRVAAARASGRLFRRCPGGCALLAVDKIGDALVHLLNDSDPMVQGAAMEGLGEMRYERGVKALTDIFTYHKSGESAWAALDTLARIGHASSVATFKAALAHKDLNFRRSAVEGLGRVGDKDSGTAIDAATNGERDAALVLAAAFAQHRSGRGVHTSRLVDGLGSKGTRLQAQEYLVELGPAMAPAVAAALAGATNESRVALLQVLGVTGTSKELAAIDPLQRDANEKVADAARRAASRIRSLKK